MRNHTCAQIWLLQTILMVTRDWDSFDPEITFSALPEFRFHTTVDEDTFVIRVALLARCDMRGSLARRFDIRLNSFKKTDQIPYFLFGKSLQRQFLVLGRGWVYFSESLFT